MTTVKSRIRKLNIGPLLREKEKEASRETARKLALAIQKEIPFLPEEERSDVRIFARIHSGREMGGDFHRAFFLDDNHLVILMGDVAGRGIETALCMSVTATLLWDLALQHLPPSEILNQANKRLSLTGKNGAFAACWVGILNTGNGELVYAQAGHGAALIKRGTHPFEETVARRNPVLGALDTGFYRESTLQMEPGDRLFLYSGGLFSIRNEEGKCYGKERLLHILNRNPEEGERTGEDRIREAEEDFSAFLSGTDPTDDYSFLALDYLAEHRTDIDTVVLDKNSTDPYGGVHFNLKTKDLFARGFRYKDMVSVRIRGQFFNLPIVPNYRNLRPGESAVIAWANKDWDVSLITFSGNFADAFGFASWENFPVPVHIKLIRRNGYESEYRNRDLERTCVRSDYPHLTDDEFANCRESCFGTIGKGKLYRGSSPVDPENARNGIADAFLRKNGVKTVLNLSYRPERYRSFPGYPETYTGGLKIISTPIDTSYNSPNSRRSLLKGFRELSESEPPFFIHCIEGQDRTGFVIAVLEALMGAGAADITKDYMLTFYNYYGVEPGTLRYNALFANIRNSVSEAFGIPSLYVQDLPGKAEGYLKGLGLTEEEISLLRKKLSRENAESSEDGR